MGNGPTVVTWSFSLDATPPEVAITSPSGNPELTDGSVTLAWTGSDAGSGIQRYEVQLDDGPPVDVGTATSLPFPSLLPGIHYFYVFAYDAVGNSKNSSALATVPASSANSNSTTLVTVVVPDGIPLWAIVLVVINAVEAAAIAWLAFGRRRPPPGTPGP